MTDEEIIAKINSFPRWHFQFNLNGNLTPNRASIVNRHRQRETYFLDPLLNLYGGSFKGKRVLDLGCNAGYWSLKAIQNGCDYVLGIDGRDMHIEQANFVFAVNRVSKGKYDFVCSNIFDYHFAATQIDVVLCLGLLYHVCKPIELLERIFALKPEVAVIDTALAPLPGSALQLKKESLANYAHAVDYETVFVPTRAALIDMLGEFRYAVSILKPQFSNYAGARDYQDGLRRAFFCTRPGFNCKLQCPIEPLD